ncbi:hypothetical protein ACFE04_009999 [Oxalis oulophora]
MKFGKEFSSQLVHEWQDVYMDYNSLKIILKGILRFKKLNKSPTMAETSRGGLKRRLSLYRTFSGLTTCYKTSPRSAEDEVILVKAVAQEEEEENGEGSRYQTTFLRPSDDVGDSELLFFTNLDNEFNKVLNFYKKKVVEVSADAEDLNRQMDVLIALRIKVENPIIQTSIHSLAVADTGRAQMETIQEVEMSAESPMHEERQDDEDEEKSIDGKTNKSNRGQININGFRPAPLDVLDRVKINVDPLTPLSTIKAILQSNSDSALSFSKVELKKAEQRIIQAFVEFHHKLRLLKRYSFLNQLAFSKIMKKYDKTTSRNASKAYLHMVDKSDVGSSDVVSYLNHSVMYGFIVLHMLMYAGDIYFWKRYRINYAFIFGFKQGTEMSYRDVLLLGSGPAVLTLSGILSNLDMEMDPKTQSYGALTELVPLALLIFLLLIIFCPFNIIYRSSRFFLIGCAFHCLATPFYKVILPDFFLADQVTSQVQALRNLEFYVCYYGWGDFKTRSNSCHEKVVYKTFNYIVAIVPYWIRFVQSIRRLVEEKDYMHALNGLKYLSTIVSVAMRTTFELNQGTTLKILAIIASGVATIANTYWDIVIDWGLLRRGSKNRWLRDKLAIPHQSVYFVAMVLNVVLRLAWMQSVLGIPELPFLHRKAIVAVVAGLEIIRRGIWNFFRLENEDLNNVGKYRAFKSVPLPFY